MNGVYLNEDLNCSLSAIESNGRCSHMYRLFCCRCLYDLQARLALLHNSRGVYPPHYLRLLCDPDGVGSSDLREAIEDCSTDFELGFLTIEGACGKALAEQLEAVHPGLDQTAAVVTAPLLPDCPA